MKPSRRLVASLEEAERQRRVQVEREQSAARERDTTEVERARIRELRLRAEKLATHFAKTKDDETKELKIGAERHYTSPWTKVHWTDEGIALEARLHRRVRLESFNAGEEYHNPRVYVGNNYFVVWVDFRASKAVEGEEVYSDPEKTILFFDNDRISMSTDGIRRNVLPGSEDWRDVIVILDAIETAGAADYSESEG